MLLNYLKLSFRLLIRNPFFACINILSLSIGTAVFILLWQYSQNELLSDRFAADYKQICRTVTLAKWTDDKVHWEEKIMAVSPVRLDRIVEQYEQVSDKTHLYPQSLFTSDITEGHGRDIYATYIDNNDERHTFPESKVIYASPNLFDFFSIPLLKGASDKALLFAESMVISESTAQKYFGRDEPVGKTVLLNDSILFQVTGVFKDLPANTHLDFDIALSTVRIQKNVDALLLRGRTRFHPFCYYKFPLEADIKSLEAKLNTFSKDEITETVYGNFPNSMAEILFQKLEDIPFTKLVLDNHTERSKYFLYTLSVGSLIVLFMAWINSVNLSISFNSKRMKELAVRKTVGARSANLIAQFLVEAFILNLAAILFAITCVQLLKSPAMVFLDFYILPWNEVPATTFLTITVALLSGVVFTGLYPAFVTLNKSPKSLFVIVGANDKDTDSASLLPIVQYTAAIILIVWIFAVHSQMDYILGKDIGLNHRNVVVIDLPFAPSPNLKNDVEAFTTKISSLAGIEGTTTSNSLEADVVEARIGIARVSGNPIISVDCNGGIDENFIPFYGIKMLAGRNFLADLPSDRDAVLMSHGAIRRLGIEEPEDAIGIRIEEARGIDIAGNGPEIIGVFEDYNLRPLLNEPNSTNYDGKPGVILTYKDFLIPTLIPKKVSLRVAPGDFHSIIRDVRNVYDNFFPGKLFSWRFLNDQIQNQYRTYLVARNQLVFFTVLVVSVACLGLVGMMQNKLIQKVKEIGIRKILGAGTHHICGVLLRKTLVHFAIATLVGIPLANLLTVRYLERFSDRIALYWWYYVVPVVVLLVILFSTISAILLRALKTNPAESLRYE